MGEDMDIRWEQRFNNFTKAFKQLEKFVNHDSLNEMEEQGLIKAFEYTYELGWKTLQDLLKHKGYQNIAGPKPVIQQSFSDGYIQNGNGWVRMHKSRNLTSHTYDDKTADEIVEGIKTEYFDLFKALHLKLVQERSGEQGSIFEND